MKFINILESDPPENGRYFVKSDYGIAIWSACFIDGRMRWFRDGKESEFWEYKDTYWLDESEGENEAIAFAEWCGKYYEWIPVKKLWHDMEREYTTEQLYQIFKSK